MADNRSPPPSPDPRDLRRAEALRANLKRRKAKPAKDGR